MPSWRDLKRFCERDGWELYKNTDRYFYRKMDFPFSCFFVHIHKIKRTYLFDMFLLCGVLDWSRTSDNPASEAGALSTELQALII